MQSLTPCAQTPTAKPLQPEPHQQSVTCCLLCPAACWVGNTAAAAACSALRLCATPRNSRGRGTQRPSKTHNHRSSLQDPKARKSEQPANCKIRTNIQQQLHQCSGSARMLLQQLLAPLHLLAPAQHCCCSAHCPGCQAVSQNPSCYHAAQQQPPATTDFLRTMR